MRVLITAFEPFGDRIHNTSADLLMALVSTPRRTSKQDIAHLVLPVSYATAWPLLKSEITKTKPDLILLMGENRRSGICIERFAHNRQMTPAGLASINAHSPHVIATRINLNTVRSQLKQRANYHGCAYHLSENAGNYLCNFIYFKTLSARPDIPSLFLHVPALAQKKFEQQATQYVSALRVILKVLGSQQLVESTNPSDTKAIDGAGTNDMPRENKRRTLMADKHLVACEQEHEMVTVLKHFKKGSSKENTDKMQNACRSWKKDGGAKYKPKNRDSFYKYLQEKGILGKLA